MHRPAASSPQGVNRDMEIRELQERNAEQRACHTRMKRYAGNCATRLGSTHKVTALGSMHHTSPPDLKGLLGQVLPPGEGLIVQCEDQLRGCGGKHVLVIELALVALGPPQPLDITVERRGRLIPNHCHAGSLSDPVDLKEEQAVRALLTRGSKDRAASGPQTAHPIALLLQPRFDAIVENCARCSSKLS